MAAEVRHFHLLVRWHAINCQQLSCVVDNQTEPYMAAMEQLLTKSYITGTVTSGSNSLHTMRKEVGKALGVANTTLRPRRHRFHRCSPKSTLLLEPHMVLTMTPVRLRLESRVRPGLILGYRGINNMSAL